jgi:hypothetical protein
MKIKLTRDEMWSMEAHCFTLIDTYLTIEATRLISEGNELANLNLRVFRSLYFETKLKFKRRLLSNANTFTIAVSEGEAIVFCHLLSKVPIPVADVWLTMVRQKVIDTLRLQIMEPNYSGTN